MRDAVEKEMPFAADGRMRIGLYGKHPARGDFIDSGIAHNLLHPLERWLDAVLPSVRASLGPGWEQVWDQGPPARPAISFWLGEAIWGEVVAGVMVPSRDRVGRRFPLLILAYGPAETALPAPVIDSCQDWYAAMAAGLHQALEETDFQSPADLIAGLPKPLPDKAHDPAPTEFWAVRPGVDVAALLADITQTDHRRALTGRSYWWRAGYEQDGGNFSGISDAAPSAMPLPAAVCEVEAEYETPATASDSSDLQTYRAFEFDELKTRELLSGGGQSSDLPAWLDPDLPEDTMIPSVPVTESFDLAAPVRVLAVSKPCQVHAGPGMPQGTVLAWFLRGA
jgi:type VI secretion system protein ImpM